MSPVGPLHCHYASSIRTGAVLKGDQDARANAGPDRARPGLRGGRLPGWVSDRHRRALHAAQVLALLSRLRG